MGLLFFGGVQLLTAIFMVVAPGTFFEEVGPFGVRNDHYVRDLAATGAAPGIGALVAIRRRSWRVPVIAVLALAYVLHPLNHLVDVGEAEPEALGPVNLVLLVTGAALILWLLARALAEAQERRP